MFIKICGITNQSDALLAVALGADALGFVLAPSPRQVSPVRIAQILPQLPSGVRTFGVFRDELPERMAQVLAETGLGGVQVHGQISNDGLAWLAERTPWVIRAVAAGSPEFDRAIEQPAWALLVDAASPGSGTVFDWSLVDGISPMRRLILAGGLRPDNVRQAIETVMPFGVDVSSGVEARPGHKDPIRLRQFIEAARGAAAALEGETDDHDRA
ncbi:Phosphoribosylanthranilate isomerase [Acidimicrobium ferrooxidans DSM 10331]|uniref:N-(5'-phosphoribosyl)anthranilate isomerase n=1 Tax=Acidimicrobium ferrooxidans (strain DSM 10331 / JCM 15462 / NBRC 103882 / ICP) TaxID=525909 RepID=C7LZ71_ACIFD|nr:Phosphoribosylanthranilate isomerase [Acidimicrobium ferrooxidans DSM 10331]